MYLKRYFTLFEPLAINIYIDRSFGGVEINSALEQHHNRLFETVWDQSRRNDKEKYLVISNRSQMTRAKSEYPIFQTSTSPTGSKFGLQQT